MLVNRTSLINSLSSELFSRRHRKALYEETQTVFSVLRRHFNVTKSENWQRHLTTKPLPYCQTAFRHYLCAQWWGLCRHNVPHSDCDIFVCLDGCCLRLGDCRSHKFLPLLYNLPSVWICATSPEMRCWRPACGNCEQMMTIVVQSTILLSILQLPF